MIVGTVLLCPSLEGEEPYDRAGVARALTALAPGLTVTAPPAPPAPPEVAWVAGVALSLTAAVRGPLLPVLADAAGTLAPRLALSQRAAHRMIAGYVLLDSPPPVADAEAPDWPDAPVVYLATSGAPPGAVDHARLRAWPCLELTDRSTEAVAAALLPWCREP